MIKKLLISIFILFLSSTIYAKECEVTCPKESTQIIENDTFLNKVTGLNFASKQIAEIIIEKELKEELNSKINAKLEIFTIKRLKKGEFKSLILKSSKIQYKALFLSDFYAQTICPFNKIFYKKSRIYYPYDLSFKYKATITNEDIQNVINSPEFQKELEKINVTKAIEIESPLVEIKNNKLFFTFPIKTFLGLIKFSFSSDIEVKNNKIMLKNISFNQKSNIINYDILSHVINNINPITYETESINSKYCKIYITNAKVTENAIKTEGIFIINKNYGENE